MSIDLSSLRLGSIGAGNMAGALVGGVIRSGRIPAAQCLAADVAVEARRRFAEHTGAETTADNHDVLRRSQIVLLAVKPNKMMAVLADIQAVAAETCPLFISIAAGISTAAIESALGGTARVVRVMPNTPALVGAGAAGVAGGAHATDEDVENALAILNAVGLAIRIEESLIDAVTALSGSGPAYFFQFVEHLIAAGIEQGLTPETADRLARQTILGAARMLTESDDSPEALRIAVTSPGGTTEAALKTFAAGSFGPLVHDAVAAAARRGRELGAS